MWKRGPEKQPSGTFELKKPADDVQDQNTSVELFENFSKTSGFYLKKDKFEKKECTFALIEIDQFSQFNQISEETVNMADYVDMH